MMVFALASHGQISGSYLGGPHYHRGRGRPEGCDCRQSGGLAAPGTTGPGTWHHGKCSENKPKQGLKKFNLQKKLHKGNNVGRSPSWNNVMFYCFSFHRNNHTWIFSPHSKMHKEVQAGVCIDNKNIIRMWFRIRETTVVLIFSSLSQNNKALQILNATSHSVLTEKKCR